MSDTTHTEIELKLRLLDPTAWDIILTAPTIAALAAPLQLEKLEAHYFDTADQALKKAGVAFRIRLEGGQWVATVKIGGTSAGGLHQRREWNMVVAEPEPNINQLQGSEIGDLLVRTIGDKPLVCLFTTVFDRNKAEIHTADGSQIELAVDIGSILAGENQAPIAEVELELKAGDPAAIIALGAELAQVLPLAVEPRSKYSRGLCLAGLESIQLPQEVPLLDWAHDARSSLEQLLISQIHCVFIAQEEFLESSANGESLHQFRIQLRRLRAFLSFAKPLVDPEHYTKWQQKLRDFGHTTGQLRDTDVLINTWQTATEDSGVILTPPPWLGILLQTERSKLSETLTAQLLNGQSTPLLLGFWAWLAAKAFLPAVYNQTLLDFSTLRLSNWIAEMRTITKDLLPNNAAQLHQLRILGKKLRYSLEVLPFKNNKTKVLLARLKHLLDCLGQLQDGQIMTEALDEWMSLHASRVVHRDAGILLGWTAFASHNTRQGFERDWRRFRRAAKRWLHDLDQ